MHKKKIFLIVTTLFLFTCTKPESKITLYHNANIYTRTAFDKTNDALAIKDSRILAIGNFTDLNKRYKNATLTDLKGKYIYPGFYDGHAHLYSLGRSLYSVDLVGTTSWEEVVDRCRKFQQENNMPFLLGRGWDQNDWPVKQFPTYEKINQYFPDIPVLLTRIDGHAALANAYLLKQSGIDIKTKIEGGAVIVKQQELTGVLIDNALEVAESHLPTIPRNLQIAYLKAAEKECFEQGLTSVVDAGLDPDIINLIDSLQKAGELKIRVYAMIKGSLENVMKYTKIPPYKTDRLNVRAFKLYADGALGSRGAYLLEKYSDAPHTRGFLLNPEKKLENIVKRVSNSDYQLNTHCIGDNANRLMLKLYAKYLTTGNDRRWRIEHAQIVHPDDYNYFQKYNIIPSVQPTHATSDGYWAEERLGSKRIGYAYPLKDFFDYTQHVALGTDFPVEKVNPLYTFYAAVTRIPPQDNTRKPFLKEQAISRQQALEGMTLNCAYAAFEEQEKGSLEVGKFADFIALDINLIKATWGQIKKARVLQTYVGGERVY